MSVTAIDADGKILLPMEIRDKLDLNSGDRLLIYSHKDGTIILDKINKKMCFEKWLEQHPVFDR